MGPRSEHRQSPEPELLILLYTASPVKEKHMRERKIKGHSHISKEDKHVHGQETEKK